MASVIRRVEHSGLIRWAGPLAVLLVLTGCTAAEPSADPPGEPAVAQLDPDVQAEWENLHREFPDAIQPEVEIIRRVDREDWATVIADCLNESGFPDVTADADGGVTYYTLTDQAEQFLIAKYICVAQYPLEKKFTSPLDDEQLGDLYDYLALMQAPCLESQGFDIPAPPSRQRFIETYATAPEWTPYGSLPLDVLMSDQLAGLQAACPEEPPADSEYYLYG